jgi:glycosyltransferase involved in cell wall biosynthesis
VHILFIPSWYPTTEAPQTGLYFVDQACALSKAGFQVGVVYPEQQSLRRFSVDALRRKHLQCKFDIEQGIPTLRHFGWNIFWRLPIRHRVRIRHARLLTHRYIEGFGRPDLIHVQSARWAGAAAEKIEHELNIPYVITEHFSGFQETTLPQNEVRLAKKGFDTARQIASVSSSLRDHLAAQNLAARDRVQVIPNMVDGDFFTPPPEPRTSDTFRFFALSHLQPWKGLDILLHAFAHAFQPDDKVELVIGGNGPERQRLKHLAQDLSIADHVGFAGRMTRQEVRSALWNADAFVHPSFEETFGVVLIEAMATGVPVLATACGGPEEIVTPETGMLVAPRDVDALAQAMQELYDTADRYDSTRIRRYAVQQFGTQAFIQRVTQMYEAATS